ncbi:hypothetical protein RRG08_026358 [Elysia crispata]|uniref:Uncharacterized protein n=1 Tax=Elysia crispata TaxID=231223 RepID=A0AAE0XNA1_9GAST|nr:hypothetical protein RRG08_026358 [Elysia crispata]
MEPCRTWLCVENIRRFTTSPESAWDFSQAQETDFTVEETGNDDGFRKKQAMMMGSGRNRQWTCSLDTGVRTLVGLDQQQPSPGPGPQQAAVSTSCDQRTQQLLVGVTDTAESHGPPGPAHWTLETGHWWDWTSSTFFTSSALSPSFYHYHR